MLMIAHMRPIRDRPNPATWDAIYDSDFPATYLSPGCLPDSQEGRTGQTKGLRCISIAKFWHVRLGESDRAIVRAELFHPILARRAIFSRIGSDYKIERGKHVSGADE